MLSPVKFESTIAVKGVPIQWIPRFELFYPDLPQFPIVYVHTKVDAVRVYGFPAALSFVLGEGEYCDVDVTFLSNINLEEHPEVKLAALKELEERFGASNRVDVNDVVKCCNGITQYEDFFRELWRYIEDLYGPSIPFGKYYEEVYSMVRFVSAWNPKTGRQSEMRMLYNFLSIFGESVEVTGRWKHMRFFLIPTYDDIRAESLSEFPRFEGLFAAMNKAWSFYFTEESSIGQTTIRSMSESWPTSKGEFIVNVSYPLYAAGALTLEERSALERLVDAFNRHPWRAAFFIWSIMSMFEKDYRQWDKSFFSEFYVDKQGVGVSEKAVACFLQQGFGNTDVIPVDTWIEAFYEHVLGIDALEDFLAMFCELGKLERAMWFSSQANKTNVQPFFDLMWCTRYGNTGNTKLRGANPLSCFECRLRPKCVGYAKIRDSNVLVADTAKVGHDGKSITSARIFMEAVAKQCLFVCVTEDKVPKSVFRLVGKKLVLVDEFSGYLLTTQKVKNDNMVLTVDQLVEGLPPFLD